MELRQVSFRHFRSYIYLDLDDRHSLMRNCNHTDLGIAPFSEEASFLQAITRKGLGLGLLKNLARTEGVGKEIYEKGGT